MGDGIDDGIGGGVGFEETGTAIDTDGFGGGRFRKPDPAGTGGGDANAFDVRKFGDAVAGIVIVGESDAVAIERFGVGEAGRVGEAVIGRGRGGGFENGRTDRNVCVTPDRQKCPRRGNGSRPSERRRVTPQRGSGIQ